MSIQALRQKIDFSFSRMGETGRSLQWGYRLALMLLVVVTIGNFFIISNLIEAQTQTAKYVAVITDQRAAFRRVSQIVGVVLRTLDQNAGNPRFVESARGELQDLTNRIERNQNTINLQQSGEAVAAMDAKPLIEKLHILSALDSEHVEWRFSVWAPIELELASNGSLMRGIDAGVIAAHQQSLAAAQRLSQIHNALTGLILLTLLAELLFIFQPLFRRLMRHQAALQAANREMEHQATHDLLTGVGNRLAMRQTVELAVASAQTARLGVMFIDIDGFKTVNDISGYRVGDLVLKTLAQRIESVAKFPANVFRVGGDEFAVIFREFSDVESLQLVAATILEKISEPIHFGGREIFVAASIGIAAPDLSSHLGGDEILVQADFALRTAKRVGNAAIQVFDLMSSEMMAGREAQAKRIAHAIRSGHIKAHYQPVVEIDTRKVVGAEALARWHCPERGIIPPSEFIQIAEEFGLIEALTESILQSLVSDRQTLLRHGIDIPFIAVNFPECLLADRHLAVRLQQLLGSKDLSWLHIEIVETALLHRAASTIQKNLSELISLGARVSLDDFGTGHASLTHLREFPCHTIKIDKSFTDVIVDDRSSQLIVQGVIEIAHGLGMSIIVEGIETDAQRDFFTQWAAILGQGYFFYRPQPMDVLIAAIEHQVNV